MSGNQTPVYDSLCKKYETTRRRIFKDVNGKYKEKLEIKNCEKRTLFGSLPFEGSTNWKLDDLSVIVDDDEDQKSDRGNVYKHSNDKCGGNSAEPIECNFKATLKKIIDKLKDDKSKDAQGVKKIFEKKCDSTATGYSKGSATSESHVT
ncbi:hypothetical protein HA402_005998 [Bradysia odoriphaga]|nr:hypothetical protein HA402_005998 [Bradysia odoriphaga]